MLLMIIGVYHKGCIDGTMAAAVLLHKFSDAKVYPLNHNFAPSDLTPILKDITLDTMVYTLDCALGVEEILATGTQVITIDHHISMKDRLETVAAKNQKFTYIFNNDKSGASLAWSYFFPELPTPRVVELVEDHDLWTCTYGQETKEINSYLMLYSDKPQEILALLNGIPDEVRRGGALLSQYIDLLVQQFSEFKPVHLKIGTHIVRGYNVTTAQSQAGDVLSDQVKAAVCLFMIRGDHVKLSFRSKDDHVPSSLDLAQMLDGGGHANSAGARISLGAFIQMINPEDLRGS